MGTAHTLRRPAPHISCTAGLPSVIWLFEVKIALGIIARAERRQNIAIRAVFLSAMI